MAFDPAYQALIKIEQRLRYWEDSNATVKRALNFEETDCEYWGNVIKINNDSFPISIVWIEMLTNHSI